MIKNVVFDLGSVIWNLHHKREYQTEDDYDFIKENLYGTKITKQLDLGNTTMDDVFEILKEKAKDNEKINIQNLKTLLQNYYDDAIIYYEVCNLIMALKNNGYGIYLLSNNSREAEESFNKLPIKKYFDGQVFSNKTKTLKPDKEIYEYLLNKYKLKAEECFFVDDKLANIIGAEKVGMKAGILNYQKDKISRLLIEFDEAGINYKTNIKNIVFDLGCVFVNESFHKYLIKGITDDPVEIEDLYRNCWKSFDSYWKATNKGDNDISDFEEAFINNCKKTRPEIVKKFIYEWPKNKKVNEKVYKKAIELKKQGYKLYALSNVSKAEHEPVKDLEEFKVFDGMLLSFEERLIKPSDEIYKRLEEKFNIKPEETVIIDDMNENNNGALNNNFYTIKFDNTKNTMKEFEEKLQFFKNTNNKGKEEKVENNQLITITIDGRETKVKKGITVLAAARQLNIDIPTLCYLKGVNAVGDCRMCLVEIEGRRGLVTSCIQQVEEGMVIHTNTPQVMEARRINLDLILSNHHKDCLTCIRSGNCELQDLAIKFNVQKIEYAGEISEHEIDDKSPSIVRDSNKCVLCRRCVATCQKVQEIGAIESTNRGFASCISTANDMSLNDVDCTFCGQCIEACPTGALHEKDSTQIVWEKLNDPDIYTVVQTAPAVRVALGEEFGMPIGTNVKGKMVTALKRMGFNKVFDTNTGADFTIAEEANEFIQRLTKGGTLPMITSCSPGWVRFCEKNYPEQLDHLSTCKSPHTMFGALIKSYFAEKYKVNPDKIFVVSAMPCIAKKFEAVREELKVDGRNDVDAVITTRELARMIKQKDIDFANIEDSEFDDPMGEASGAAAIFGTTGGVMEAALRTAADTLENKEITNIEYHEIRGGKGLKEAEFELAGKKLRICVASGLSNARKIMDEIKAGKSNYDFIEIMACPGGCVMGGGQPIKSSKIRETVDVRKLRADALYTIDEKSKIRKSHENPELKKIYEEFLQHPGSEQSHKYLHTSYKKEEKYNF